METIHGYELITEWKNSQCGQTARASKGGKTYFMKKYQTPVEPVMNGALDERTFNNNKKQFDQFVARRVRVNTQLRTIAGSGGNIVIPREEFVYDHHYIEAAELVEGAVSDDDLVDVLSGLNADVKKLLMLTAVGALVSVHRLGIIHSDLKLKNVLLAKNMSNNYVAKLIDFDSSYFMDDIPTEVVGDINYYSPELGTYSGSEDEEDDVRAELRKALTDKSDIFSLGLIFHFYLSGELPEAKTLTDKLKKRKEKGKTIYCWTILNNGCELKMSSKIRSIKYLSLIQDMLALNPADRPTASEVLRRLQGAEEAGVIDDAWPEHKINVDKTKIKNAGYIALKKVTKSGVKQYTLTASDGKKTDLTRDELVEKGFAKILREEKFAEPWNGHNIRFNETKLRARGFVASERRELGGVKGYEIYRSDADDSSQFFTVEKLIAMGFAETVKVGPEKSFCKPWREHKVDFDLEQIEKRGFVRIEQSQLSGVKGYTLTKEDGTEQFIKVEMMLVLKMAKRL